MTKILRLLIPAFFFLSSALFPKSLPEPSPRPSLPPSPHIRFEETSYQAGPVWEGEKASHIFRFKNTGSAPLHIKRARTSCGCTAALVSKREIEPGQEGEIKVEFNTRRYRGNQRKTVYVSTNDLNNPNLQLHLSAQVRVVASFSPRKVNFRKVRHGEKACRVIKLVPEGGPFKITGLKTDPEFFQARILGGTSEVGEDNEPLQIEVSLNPEAPLGRHSGKLSLFTDHPKLHQLQARLYAEVEEN